MDSILGGCRPCTLTLGSDFQLWGPSYNREGIQTLTLFITTIDMKGQNWKGEVDSCSEGKGLILLVELDQMCTHA